MPSNADIAGESCPFSVGDIVQFSPDERTIGWYTIGGFFGLVIGEVGMIERIDDGFVYLSDARGGFHWKCFRLAAAT